MCKRLSHSTELVVAIGNMAVSLESFGGRRIGIQYGAVVCRGFTPAVLHVQAVGEHQTGGCRIGGFLPVLAKQVCGLNIQLFCIVEFVAVGDERGRQIKAQSGQAGIENIGAPHCRHGFSRCSQFETGLAKIDPRCCVSRIQSGGFGKAGRRRSAVTQCGVNIAAIEMIERDLRAGLDGGIDRLQGASVVATLMQHNAQQMQGARVVCLCRQYGAVDALGLFQLPRLVQCNGSVQINLCTRGLLTPATAQQRSKCADQSHAIPMLERSQRAGQANGLRAQVRRDDLQQLGKDAWRAAGNASGLHECRIAIQVADQSARFLYEQRSCGDVPGGEAGLPEAV